MGALIRRAFVVLVFSLIGAQAHAEPSATDQSSRAKAHFDLGRTHFTLGEFEAAAKEFEQAYQYEPAPLLLYNAGQSWRRADQPEKALAYYRKYMETAPNAPERAEVEQYIAGLRERIEKHPAQPVETAAEPSTPSTPPVAPAQPPPWSSSARAEKPSAPPAKRKVKTAWIVTACLGGAILAAGAITLGILVPQANDPAPSTLGSVTPSWMSR